MWGGLLSSAESCFARSRYIVNHSHINVKGWFSPQYQLHENNEHDNNVHIITYAKSCP